jgi:drug/metabolite transporter (DMT)-like permease
VSARRTAIGAFFAILSTISFGLSDAAIRRGLQGISIVGGIYITVFLGIPLLVIAAAITGQLFHLNTLSTTSYILLVASGLVQFLLGRYTLYRCLSAIGANRSTPVRSLAVPFTLLLAFFVLGERVTAINGVGIMVVMLAPMIMFQTKAKTTTIGTPRLAEGYFFAFINALAFGCNPPIIREAIGDTGMGIAGALVSYSAAAVPLLLA